MSADQTPPQKPEAVYLKDYKPYPYSLLSVDLNFDLHESKTQVSSKLVFKKERDEDLVLNGEDLHLVSVKLDGKIVTNNGGYDVKEGQMTLPCPKASQFTLEIKTIIKPEDNTYLEGLYKSGDMYCTQCEAQGFRRITYFPDRPDVLSIYTVRLEGDKTKYPILLSNGELQNSGEIDNGRHFAIWHDKTPKPCYLFALVAGDLNHVHNSFTTMSGQNVDLYIYVRPGDEKQCAHAMESLIKSMKWDEDVYGREYQYSIFNIVAVSDFNMGAMENTALNIFNTALVLAEKETATDHDFIRVESVIAHEYFHNWTGNRVTCRDWFQLSLKEGLTVFRDQEFSADMHSKAVQRIDDVAHLRRLQFAEDAGPLSHPIRPENYIEINNFYTMTVYEKGAEVIRMFRTLMGDEAYRKSTDLYFDRHDGQAVTCEDWIKAMEDGSGMDFSHFRLWYSQAGTPHLRFYGRYDADAKTYHVTLSQNIPDTSGQKNKQPMVMPVAMGLIGKNGADLIGTQILELREAEQSFEFTDIESRPVPSVLRNFSAPVILDTNLKDNEYRFLSQHEIYDGFNRWEALQILGRRVIGRMLDQHKAGENMSAPDDYIDGFSAIFKDAMSEDADKALLARALQIPSVDVIVQDREFADPVVIHKARQMILAAIKRTHRKALDKIYKINDTSAAFSVDAKAMGRRALRNQVLSVLTCTDGTGCAKLAKAHYESADNMTDRMAALSALANNKNAERDEVLSTFYKRFEAYPLVIDKWFAVQAAATHPDIIKHLKTLRAHEDFNIKNPNRVRSLYASFAMNNPASFHHVDGSGYTFLADAVIELNKINPQIASRLLTPMRAWRQYSKDRQENMKAALERIADTPDLSPNVFEIVEKSLKG